MERIGWYGEGEGDGGVVVDIALHSSRPPGVQGGGRRPFI